ncbi:uncharacterized protein LOC126739419 isoform X2 [Anthonomus grandis grandis]|uniref:uncharacterized protein LOC126739419 isoform X2 n=1 Tax=Anthonomus grandis grandis TaxID=2921223 RepID=UPI0021664A57|nr:uncharacterized protein LOC126739419 isoform X2 [Anthonomus grandis grandis]
MDINRDNKLICEDCGKSFSSTSTLYRHMRDIHNKKQSEKESQHIICPLCLDKEKFTSYDSLIRHFHSIHNIHIKESVLNFRNLAEFEIWRSAENREVDYAVHRRKKCANGEEFIYYNCNRSDSKGYVSTCLQRYLKSKGSIRMQGICPSRIIVKILVDGVIRVRFFETHIGHPDELRSKRLTKSEQEIIVNKLAAGISNKRIIQEARSVDGNKLQRKNCITRGHLEYLIRKFNIDKKRDSNDMIATVLKIQEWNSDGKNHGFLFKQIGETYPGLEEDDFAVGYMNAIMEKKLRDFPKIICIDGTHGTNRRNWDLTIVLIRDEQNMGFPGT